MIHNFISLTTCLQTYRKKEIYNNGGDSNRDANKYRHINNNVTIIQNNQKFQIPKLCLKKARDSVHLSRKQ